MKSNVGQTASQHDSHWKPVCGERSTIRDHYRQVVVELKETKPPHRLLRLTFRVYNEGAALCYTLPQQPGLERVNVLRENTEFRFSADSPAWATYMAQGDYAQVPVSKIKRGCERPLVVEVDVHDEYRLTGYSRTCPNLMTAEGIRGDETSPTNATTLAIAFTRMLTGPADNTVCYYDPRVDRNACHAYQLAKPVCLFSPWQFLYWYDRPQGSPAKIGGAGGTEPRIGSDPELEFYDSLPTVWDETQVLHGQIGQYAVIARRHGDEWFIGCMNAGQARTFPVSLSFLEPGKKYVAHRYVDDPGAATRTHVRIERMPADANSVLNMTLGEKGGAAIRIVPAAR